MGWDHKYQPVGRCVARARASRAPLRGAATGRATRYCTKHLYTLDNEMCSVGARARSAHAFDAKRVARGIDPAAAGARARSLGISY